MSQFKCPCCKRTAGDIGAIPVPIAVSGAVGSSAPIAGDFSVAVVASGCPAVGPSSLPHGNVGPAGAGPVQSVISVASSAPIAGDFPVDAVASGHTAVDPSPLPHGNVGPAGAGAVQTVPSSSASPSVEVSVPAAASARSVDAILSPAAFGLDSSSAPATKRRRMFQRCDPQGDLVTRKAPKRIATSRGRDRQLQSNTPMSPLNRRVALLRHLLLRPRPSCIPRRPEARAPV